MRLFNRPKPSTVSELFDEKTFYQRFLQDLKQSRNEVIIESPYMTTSRMEMLYPTLERLLTRKVQIYIVTRDPVDHEDEYMRYQATNEILHCNELGIITILMTGYHHRKLAIIDRSILWEGSLNILSQSYSREIMRRMEKGEWAQKMFDFLQMQELLKS